MACLCLVNQRGHAVLHAYWPRTATLAALTTVECGLLQQHSFSVATTISIVTITNTIQCQLFLDVSRFYRICCTSWAFRAPCNHTPFFSRRRTLTAGSACLTKPYIMRPMTYFDSTLANPVVSPPVFSSLLHTATDYQRK